VVLIPRHHAPELIAWLDHEVAPNQPYAMPDRERTAESRLNPYHVSATAQIATWRGAGDAWKVVQSSRSSTVQVTCQDPHWETVIVMKWS